MQGDLVGVVHQAIEDGIGERWLPHGLMPRLDGQLARHHRRPTVVTIFEQLQQIAAMLVTQRRQAPVIEEQQLCLGQRGHQFWIAPVASGDRQFLEQPG